jgi:radical SAM family uncharacterized protein/radical SAM-linked protein
MFEGSGMMGDVNSEDLLLSVGKPSRYLGAEVNAERKCTEVRFRFVIAFPDAYEVGMSHLGIQIIYSMLNGLPYVAAERCFAPWPDMEQLLRKHKRPLVSLETHRPLFTFDMIGFSLQYELSYTNVLNMMELGRIPILREKRGEMSPLIIAGGPCAFNPAPMDAFIDAFVIGEGEEVILEIAAGALKAKDKGLSRDETLAVLAEIEGIYVPAIRKKKRIRKRIISDLNLWPIPAMPVVPLMKTIHDRITIEIARGCTRGCRFCQAGMVWRPVRERKQEVIEKAADSILCATGYDEISLLSLSSGDYSRIESLLSVLVERYYEKRVALALPSLRVETLTQSLMENIRRVRKTSFTLAPEAGTQRLRKIINKGNTEAELLSTVNQVFAAGWKSVKLYFMIGLPGEGKEDLEGIADLAYQALKEGKKRGRVTVSLSTFVPKPQTPFQWQGQIGIEDIRKKQAFIKDRIRNRNINVKWHDARMSFLEGILSRGDEKTGALIEKAFRLGCRFDGWADMFRFDLWEEALLQTNIKADDYLKERTKNEEFPWDSIDCGVGKAFLLSERCKARTGEFTPDCRFTDCQNCGVCDHETIKIVTASSFPQLPAIKEKDGKDISPCQKSSSLTQISTKGHVKTLRLKITKLRPASFLSHLEVSEALIRAIKRSGISFVYSQGYHPHPKISFSSTTAVGMESMDEYADIQIETENVEPANMEKINFLLPEGLIINEIEHITFSKASLAKSVKGFSYTIFLTSNIMPAMPGLKESMECFLSTDKFVITREVKGKTVEKNIRPMVASILVDENGCLLIFTVRIKPEGSVRPLEILTEIGGIDRDLAKTMRIVRTKTHFEDF